MKKVITTLFSSMVYLCLFYYSDAQTIEMKRVPTGGIAINGKNISIQGFNMSNEITNKEYREFVDFLIKHPDDSLITIASVQKISTQLFDSLSFKKIIVKNRDALKNIIDSTVMDKEIKHYFTNKVYDNYPVVGVSYNNANLFCIWKTNMERTKKGSDMNIMYRIPNQSEWVYASSYLNTEWPVPDDKKGKVQPVNSGNFDKNGLYNLSGNVSEWTATTKKDDKQVVMGGSWKTKADKDEEAELPADTKTNYIGFRIVATYLGRSK